MATFNGDDRPGTFNNPTRGTLASIPGQTYVSTSGPGVASVIYYLWRASDAALGRTVYWYATSAEQAGATAEYTEGAGPLSDIHLIKRKQ